MNFLSNSELEEVIKSINSVQQQLQEQKITKQPLKQPYYLIAKYSPDEEPEFYIFMPSFVQVKRATQSELGFGTLGVAYLGTNIVKILDTLHGKDFLEVLKHEYHHILNPNHTEKQTRECTKQSLPFDTKYH